MPNRTSLFFDVVWKRFRRNRFAVAGGIIVLVMILVSLLAPYITPYAPDALDAYSVLLPPSSTHWLGTDDVGRDVLTRLIFGAQISLKVGFISIGIATVIGTLVGLVSGYYGGITDSILMRFVDIMLCFPTFFLILAVIAIREPSINNIMIVIGATSWMGISRLVRAEVLSIRERDYIMAARAIGCSDARIIFRHILPNAIGPVLVFATLGIAGAILTESALSFLGLGVLPPTPSWGNILASGKEYLEFAWWLFLFPGLAIMITVLAYYLLGEGIRDALDPRLQR